MKTNKLLKNKKGFAWIPLIIIGGLITLIIGGASVFKFNQVIGSIPWWFWAIVGFVILLLIIRRR